VLLEDGGEVRFGDIIGKGAIAEDHIRFTGRGHLLVPGNDAKRQRFYFRGGDLFGEADQKRASASGAPRASASAPSHRSHAGTLGIPASPESW
jgi:hypothetical protein